MEPPRSSDRKPFTAHPSSLDLPPETFPTFDAREIMRQIDPKITWEAADGPFGTSSLSVEKRAEVNNKVIEYRTTFFHACYKPQMDKVKAEREEFGTLEEKNEKFLEQIATREWNEQAVEDALKKVKNQREPQIRELARDLHIQYAHENYFHFRKNLQSDFFWKACGKAIKTLGLSEEENNAKKRKLERFRKDFCSEEANHFAHYSPQALICACKVFTELKTIMQKAMQSLGMASESKSSDPSQLSKMEQAIGSFIKKAEQVVETAIQDDSKKKQEFHERYESHLEKFSKALEMERTRLCAALETRFRMALALRDFSHGDFLQFVVHRLLKSFGYKSALVTYTFSSQTDGEWNALCGCYLKLGGSIPLEKFLFIRTGLHDKLCLPFRVVPHNKKGWVTCLDEGGAAPNDSEFQGSSPAVLMRYYLTLRNAPTTCEESSFKDWNPLISQIVEEMQRLPTAASVKSGPEKKLILDWTNFWFGCALILFSKFSPFLEYCGREMQVIERLPKNSLILLRLLARLTTQLSAYKLKEDCLDTVKPARKLFTGIYETLVNVFIIRLNNALPETIEPLVDLLVEIAPQEKKKGWEACKRALRHSLPVPSATELRDCFESLNRPGHTLRAIEEFLRIIVLDCHNFKDEYVILAKELSDFIDNQLNTTKKDSVYAKWESDQKDEIQKAKTIIFSNLKAKQSPKFTEEYLTNFFDALDHLPKEKQKAVESLQDYLRNHYQPSQFHDPFLVRLLRGLGDIGCLELFLDKFFEGNPSLRVLETNLVLLEEAFSRFPSCRQKVRGWLLSRLNAPAPFPNIFTSDAVLSVVEKVCPDAWEEIFYAIDRRCLEHLRGAIPTEASNSASVAEMRTFISGLSSYSFPFSKRGEEEYRTFLSSFPPDAWNPLVWEVVQQWGPEEVRQQWRLVWLKAYARRNDFLIPSKEIFRGIGNQTGYFALCALFGREGLTEALETLTDLCRNARSLSSDRLRFWREVRILLGSSSLSLMQLDKRDEKLNRDYGRFQATFQEQIHPILDRENELKAMLQARKWGECFKVLMRTVRVQHVEAVREVLWHIDNVVGELFVETDVNDKKGLERLKASLGLFQVELLVPLSRIGASEEVKKLLVPFCEKMGRVCRDYHPLYQFCTAFFASSDEDWLLAFKEGAWKNYFPLLNERMREGCLVALNSSLPLCTSAESHFAWLDVLYLLQGRHPNPRGILAQMDTLVSKMRETSADSSQVSKEQTWRRGLEVFLPASHEISPPCYSITRGPCSWVPELQKLVRPDGTCAVPKKEEYAHPVAPLRIGNVPVYFKWEPHALGIQLLGHYLCKFVVGGHTPFLDLVKLVGKKGFFQLSETISGCPLNILMADRSAPVPKIDPKSYSENIIQAFLTCEGDGKAGNYVATKVKGTDAFHVTMVDGELAFNPPYMFTKEGEIKFEILMACILFYFDQIDDPLHPDVAERLKNLDIHLALRRVLVACKQARRRMISCIEENEESQAWDQTDPRYLSISLQQRYLEHWYTVLLKIQHLLKAPELPTHRQLLEALFPPIARVVNRVHMIHKHPEARFGEAHKGKYKTVLIRAEGEPERSSFVTQYSREILQLCLANEGTHFDSSSPSLSVDTAIEKLEEIDQQIRTIAPIRRELQKGNLGPFLEIKLQALREVVLWGSSAHPGLKWEDLSPELQVRLLNTIKIYPFKQLHLANCRTLTAALLGEFFQHSPELEILNISGCIGLEALPPLPPSLQRVDISGTAVRTLTGTFPCLEELKANGSKLERIDSLHVPQLEALYLLDCYHLTEILFTPSLGFKNLFGKGCLVEAALKLRLIHFGEQVKGTFSLESKDEEGETLFNACVELNLLAQIDAILALPSFGWTPGKKGRSPLHYAVALSNEEMVRRLAGCPLFTFAQDERGFTPLMAAAADNNIRAVELLLPAGEEHIPANFRRMMARTVSYFVPLLESLLPEEYRSNNHVLNVLRYSFQHERTDIVRQICGYINDHQLTTVKHTFSTADLEDHPELALAILPEILKAELIASDDLGRLALAVGYTNWKDLPFDKLVQVCHKWLENKIEKQKTANFNLRSFSRRPLIAISFHFAILMACLLQPVPFNQRLATLFQMYVRQKDFF